MDCIRKRRCCSSHLDWGISILRTWFICKEIKNCSFDEWVGLKNLSCSYDASLVQESKNQTRWNIFSMRPRSCMHIYLQCKSVSNKLDYLFNATKKLGVWSLGLQVKGKSCWDWNDVTNIGVIWKFEHSILCCVSSPSLPMVHCIFSLLICMGSLESSTQMQSF
jgi:hypothetical protein